MSQCERIIEHMKKYGSITTLEAMQQYGIMRLASRIHDIRRMGIKIKVETVNAENRYGEKTSFCRYSLEPND